VKQVKRSKETNLGSKYEHIYLSCPTWTETRVAASDVHREAMGLAGPYRIDVFGLS
jgi:hypothetical protein